jgi:MraZ protein
MFQGASQLSLDPKGRLAIPTRHRSALQPNPGDRVVVTAHPRRCLLVYPDAAWAPRRAQIQTFSSFDPVAASWRRVLLGHAEDQEPDSAGRLLISPVLRKYAGLDKQVMLVGQGSHFELWDLDAWDAEMNELASLSDRPPPGLENFAL